MSSFEFLSVLISVVVGLGIANMLTGFSRLVQRRHGTRFSLIHIAWSVFTFLMLVVYWWTVVFGWKDWEDWNILLFLFLLWYGVLLFFLSSILYPYDMPEGWDPVLHFIDMRRWFFGVIFLWICSELADTYFKDHFDDFAAPYIALMGSWSVLLVVGWLQSNLRAHAFIALWFMLTLTAWVIYQLRNLDLLTS